MAVLCSSGLGQSIRRCSETNRRSTLILGRAASHPDTALIELFKTLQLVKPSDAPCFILIDSLDEALTVKTGADSANRFTITDLICNPLVIRSLPSWCRIVCTTRPDAAIRFREAKQFSAHTINADSGENRLDVVNFIKAELDPQLQTDRSVAVVADYCAGNFLIAREVMMAVNDRVMSVDQLWNAVSQLHIPSNLSVFYHDLFVSRFSVQRPLTVPLPRDVQILRHMVAAITVPSLLYSPGIVMITDPVRHPRITFDSLFLLVGFKVQELTIGEFTAVFDKLRPCLRGSFVSIELYHRSMGEWIFSNDAGILRLDEQIPVEMMYAFFIVSFWVLVRSADNQIGDRFSNELCRMVDQHVRCFLACGANDRTLKAVRSAFTRRDGSLDPMPPSGIVAALFRYRRVPRFNLVSILDLVQLLRLAKPNTKDFSIERPSDYYWLFDWQVSEDDMKVLFPFVIHDLGWNPYQVRFITEIESGSAIRVMVNSCGYDPNRLIQLLFPVPIFVCQLGLARNGDVVNALLECGAQTDPVRDDPLYFQLRREHYDRGRNSALVALMEAGIKFKDIEYGFSDELFERRCVFSQLPWHLLNPSAPSDVTPHSLSSFVGSPDFQIVFDWYLKVNRNRRRRNILDLVCFSTEWGLRYFEVRPVPQKKTYHQTTLLQFVVHEEGNYRLQSQKIERVQDIPILFYYVAVEAILRRGVSLSVRDETGATPLHSFALLYCMPSMFSMLYDLFRLLMRYTTAYDLACVHKDRTVTEMIVKTVVENATPESAVSVLAELASAGAKFDWKRAPFKTQPYQSKWNTER